MLEQTKVALDHHSGQPVEFNLHDIVGIRLEGATPEDVAVVQRQLGPIRGPLPREPEIIVRFVDHLDTPPVRYAGLELTGFTDDSFLVLRGKRKLPVRVKIPLEQVGGQCEIVCERGLPAVPLLIPIINFTALVNGALPLHAGAFIEDGKGVLVTGWSKGGKTEALLGFMAHGATYVGDEWVYLTDGGRRMYGIPEPVRVWEWHLQEMPSYRAQLAGQQRLRLAALRALMSGIDRFVGRHNGRGSFPARFLRRVRPYVKKQQGLNVPPERLFGSGRYAVSAPVDQIFFVVSGEAPEIKIAPIGAAEVARRMVFSLEEEQQRFLSYYWQFRFAFPERANKWIDQRQEIQRRALLEMLADKEAYIVSHPYPVPIEALYEAMKEYVTKK